MEQIGTGSSYFHENGKKQVEKKQTREKVIKEEMWSAHMLYSNRSHSSSSLLFIFYSHLHFIITRIYSSRNSSRTMCVFFFKYDAFITPSTSMFYIGHLFVGSASNQTDQDIPLIC